MRSVRRPSSPRAAVLALFTLAFVPPGPARAQPAPDAAKAAAEVKANYTLFG